MFRGIECVYSLLHDSSSMINIYRYERYTVLSSVLSADEKLPFCLRMILWLRVLDCLHFWSAFLGHNLTELILFASKVACSLFGRFKRTELTTAIYLLDKLNYRLQRRTNCLKILSSNLLIEACFLLQF